MNVKRQIGPFRHDLATGASGGVWEGLGFFSGFGWLPPGLLALGDQVR